RTETLLDAVRRHHARLGYVSSFTTLPRRDTGLGVLEAQWRRRIHPYFAVKQLVEDLIVDAAGTVGAAIVNPAVCMGPWDGKPRALCFLPQLVAGEVWFTVEQAINVIDVREVAAALCGALEAE